MRIALAVLGCLLPAGAAGDPPDLQITGVAGWGGRAHPGEFVPVLVDLDNKGKKDATVHLHLTWAGRLEVQPQEHPTLEGVLGRTGPLHTLDLPLPAKSRKRVSMCLLAPDQAKSSVWAFATDPGSRGTLARAELPVRILPPDVGIVALVGRDRPAALEQVGVEVANIQPDELPDEWRGYLSLEALVWLDGRALEVRSGAPLDAIRQWVSAGGRFLAARSQGTNLSGTAVADLLPVTLGSTREVASLGGGRLPDGGSAVLGSTVRRGAVRAESEGVPLIVEAGRDAGRVTFVAFDPSGATWDAWPGAASFWRWLLDLPDPAAPGGADRDRSPAAIGSPALSRQASRFPDVAAPQIGGLFLLMMLYLVVVGPLDYVVLRTLRKLEYTWFTFPAYVAIFTLFILLAGGAFIQRPGYQREIVVVDHYPDTGFVRRRGLSAVLSPADQRYRVPDAEPLSSNFYEIAADTFSDVKTTDVSILEAPERMAVDWVLNLNYTGLAFADRCASSASPLSYAIESETPVDLRVAVRNGTGGELAGSWLLTPRGHYELERIPPGQATVTGRRRTGALSVPGALASLPAVPAEEPWADRGGLRVTASQIDPEVRRTLLDLSFPFPGRPEPRRRGLARALEATSWVRSGGSVLLAWPATPAPLVRFDPAPGRYTSVTLLRFFQGPPP